MTRLTWDADGKYVSGVRYGVLYLSDGTAVPWNGLTSVEEDVSDVISPFYIDGVRYLNTQESSDYVATVKAFTYPDEFLEYEGGLAVTEQGVKTFGMSYRSKVGDVEELHVMYNLMAIPNVVDHVTMNAQTSGSEFSWTIHGMPVHIPGFKPTAHAVFELDGLDSTLISSIESMLYGDADNAPSLPSLDELKSFLENWHYLTITDNQDGTFDASSPYEGVITFLDATTVQITGANVLWIDADTFMISTTEEP
jgi:hypothetical protein